MVVSDAGPLHYLLLAGAEEPLRILYGRVLVPQTVATELRHQHTPATVQAWIARPPQWCEIVLDPPYDPSLQSLDPGERAAIALAVLAQVDRLLIDEQAGRAEAQRRSLLVTGTLGVLVEAHRAGLLDFEEALMRIQQTNFYASAELIDRIRRSLPGLRRDQLG